MSGEQISLVALAAVLMFWAVGAYNRLVQLRSAIAGAWAKVDDALRQRSAAADALQAALREPLAAEQGALDAWQAALAEATRATTMLGGKPVMQAHAVAWVAAEAAQSAAVSRVLALLEQQAELRQSEPVAGQMMAWQDADKRLRFARLLFNEAAVPYDEAIATFPTSLLVRAFRFKAAGRL